MLVHAHALLVFEDLVQILALQLLNAGVLLDYFVVNYVFHFLLHQSCGLKFEQVFQSYRRNLVPALVLLLVFQTDLLLRLVFRVFLCVVLVDLAFHLELPGLLSALGFYLLNVLPLEVIVPFLDALPLPLVFIARLLSSFPPPPLLLIPDSLLFQIFSFRFAGDEKRVVLLFDVLLDAQVLQLVSHAALLLLQLLILLPAHLTFSGVLPHLSPESLLILADQFLSLFSLLLVFYRQLVLMINFLRALIIISMPVLIGVLLHSPS